ncbi:uncharacterized protein VTP21DRAFT_6585 [Calcarisporiella thermophila]|uniref:uncharacterized protein n=1 Tax=Calcarisporiella thermophila TaxID=911321 RepID=UPI0037437F98
MKSFNYEQFNSDLDMNNLDFMAELDDLTLEQTNNQQQGHSQPSAHDNLLHQLEEKHLRQQHQQQTQQNSLSTPIESGYFSNVSQDMFLSPLTMEASNMLLDDNLEDDLILTPLISPTPSPFLTPSQTYSLSNQDTITPNEIFSPLTSPALLPQEQSTDNSSQSSTLRPKSKKRTNDPQPYVKVRQTIAKGGRTTARKRNSVPNSLSLPSAVTSSSSTSSQLETSMPPPATRPLPATPASLMNLPSQAKGASEIESELRSSPAMKPISPTVGPMHFRGGSVPTSPAIKPYISPSLKPLLPGAVSQEVAARLATKSNYQTIRDGDSKLIGLSYSPELHSGIEMRRSSHKAAEQKRRDLLKHCFDDLRSVLPDIEEKNPSKVMLLRKSYEYISGLNKRAREQDAKIESLQKEIMALKDRLGLGGEEKDQQRESSKG